MANKKQLTPGQAALNRSFRKTALILDPVYGEIHNQLVTIEQATEKIRRRLVALAKKRN